MAYEILFRTWSSVSLHYIPGNDFKACFICGEACNIKNDVGHPDHWEKNPGILCKTADQGFSKDSLRRKYFKGVLLKVR